MYTQVIVIILYNRSLLYSCISP